MKIELTEHAKKRAHQRLSLKKRSLKRAAKIALERGNAIDGRIADPWVLGNLPTITSGREIRAYGNAYYVFEYTRESITLITLMVAKSQEKGVRHEYAN